MTQEQLTVGNIVNLKDGTSLICLSNQEELSGYTISLQPIKVIFTLDDIEEIELEHYDPTYDNKIDDKREHLENAAATASNQSESYRAKSSQIGERFAQGQPIMIGHHSEAGARRDKDRVYNAAKKSYELQKKSTYLSDKAEAVGTCGISSDDPSNIQQYAAKLIKLEASQVLMKATNKVIKSKAKKYKGDNCNELKIKDLIDLGMSEDAATQLLTTRDFLGNLGFAPFELTNNGATIRSTKQKLVEAVLQKAKKLSITENPEFRFDDLAITVIHNYTDNRLQFEFDTTDACKEAKELFVFRGFNRSHYTLQRKLTGLNVESTTNYIIKELRKELPNEEK